jgi:hypothetical protein
MLVDDLIMMLFFAFDVHSFAVVFDSCATILLQAQSAGQARFRQRGISTTVKVETLSWRNTSTFTISRQQSGDFVLSGEDCLAGNYPESSAVSGPGGSRTKSSPVSGAR